MMIFLQANATDLIGQFLPLGLILIVMYFFFLRPQAKKQKAQMDFNANLQKGQKVVTGAGLIGTITKMDNTTVTLQISQKGYVDVMRSAVSQEMTEALEKSEG